MCIFLLFFLLSYVTVNHEKKESENPISLVILCLFIVLIKSYMSCWTYLKFYPWISWPLVQNIGWAFFITSPISLYPLFTLLCPLRNWHINYKDYMTGSLVLWLLICFDPWEVSTIDGRVREWVCGVYSPDFCWYTLLPRAPSPVSWLFPFGPSPWIQTPPSSLTPSGLKMAPHCR